MNLANLTQLSAAPLGRSGCGFQTLITLRDAGNSNLSFCSSLPPIRDVVASMEAGIHIKHTQYCQRHANMSSFCHLSPSSVIFLLIQCRPAHVGAPTLVTWSLSVSCACLHTGGRFVTMVLCFCFVCFLTCFPNRQGLFGQQTPSWSCANLKEAAFSHSFTLLGLPWNSPVCCDWPATHIAHRFCQSLVGNKGQ